MKTKMPSDIQRQMILNAICENGSMNVMECSKYMPFGGLKDYGQYDIALLRVKELEREGLVKKTIDPQDRRKKIVSITDEGKKKYKKLELLE